VHLPDVTTLEDKRDCLRHSPSRKSGGAPRPSVKPGEAPGAGTRAGQRATLGAGDADSIRRTIRRIEARTTLPIVRTVRSPQYRKSEVRRPRSGCVLASKAAPHTLSTLAVIDPRRVRRTLSHSDLAMYLPPAEAVEIAS
jgi:hypothetical protein